MIHKLKNALERAESWPEDAEIALEIDAPLHGGTYHASADELRAIDEADGSGTASAAEVEAAFRRA